MSRELKSRTKLRLAIAAVCAASLCVVGCDDRTAEEKGRDYAEEKVGFAEGAAGVLEDKGKGLGESIGKGVGDLVKGTGSALKDVVHPPVTVKPAPGMEEKGIRVIQAHEGEDDLDKRNVVAYLEFPKAFHGRLQLRAFDAEGQETGRSDVSPNVSQAAGTNENVTFGFPGDMRLSKVDHCLLHALEPKTVNTGLPGVKVSQLKEDGQQVSVYVVFEKSYRGGLQLRAANRAGEEIGRSEPTSKLAQDADTASHLSFTFDANAPLADSASYALHKAKPKPKPAATE
jgi:hypothetical protein